MGKKKRNQTPKPAITEKKRNDPGFHVWAIVLLVLAGVSAYHNSLGGEFLFDDLDKIQRNPEIQRLWPIPQGNDRPLVYLTFALNYAFGGLDVRWYHVVNLLIHILTALTLFGVVRRTFLSPLLKETYKIKSLPFAFVVVLIWTVHPLQTEAVTYIWQRSESLVGYLYLFTLYCVIRFLELLSEKDVRPSKIWQGLAVGACTLGMLTKPVMVTAPLVMMIYDRIFFAKSFKEIFTSRKWFYAGLAATWLLLIFVVKGIKGYTVDDRKLLTPLEYALTEPQVILHYLKLTIWPHPLILDYQWPAAKGVLAVGVPSMMIVILLFLTGWALRFYPALGFLGVWFFFILSPTSTILPLDGPAFEHRMYLPLAAVIILIVLLAEKGFMKWVPAKETRWYGRIVLVVIVLILLGFKTIRRNLDYRSRLIMWSDVVKKRPDNPRANCNLGLAYFETGNKDKALVHYLKAVQFAPDYHMAHNNLGNFYFEKGDFEKSAYHFQQALRIRPNYVETHNNYGVLLMEKKEYAKSEYHLLEAVRLNSDLPDVWKNLGNLYYLKGDQEKAVESYKKALTVKPDFLIVQSTLAAIYYQQKRFEEARQQYLEILRKDPYDVTSLNALGGISLNQGRMDQAIKYFQEALRIQPDYADAKHNLNLIRGRVIRP